MLKNTRKTVKRISILVFSVGGLFMAMGVMTLLSGLAETGTGITSPTSAVVFSFGAMLTGAGFMLRARESEANLRPSKEAGQLRNELLRTNGACTVCNHEPAIVRCNLHKNKLCSTCISLHDTVWCDYIPSGRKSTAPGKALRH